MRKPLRVLFVEDDPDDVELARHVLDASGYDVSANVVKTMASFREAFGKDGGCDIILLDHHLPRFDAKDFLEFVRERPGSPPVVMVSGEIDEKAVIETLKQGAFDYVFKNDLKRLPAAIEGALKLSREHAARCNAEQELGRVTERLESVSLALSGAAWEWEPETGRWWWGPGLKECFGFDNTPGHTSYDFWLRNVHPEDRDRADGSRREALRAGANGWKCSYRFRNGAGEYLFVSDFGRLVPAQPGLPKRITGFIANTTASKRIEDDLRTARDASEAALRAKDEFLAMMSHELRTPLNPILGFTELLQERHHDIESQSYLQVISQSANHLLQLLNDVLDLARHGAQQRPPEQKALSLPGLLKEVIEAYQLRASSRGIDLSSAFDKSLPPEWIGDARRLRQVLVNLVGNAVKFTENGRIELSVSPCVAAAQKSSGLIRLRFEVRDTGAGITQSQIDRLFQPFVQLTRPPNRQHEGSGLGLAISKRLVESMDGVIGCTSKVGTGTTFWFEIPMQPSKAASAPTPASETPAIAGRILLVEDDLNSLKVMRAMLKRLSLDVDEARSGEEALACFTPGRFKIILLDMTMPGIDGHETLKRLREKDDSKRPTPVIAQTAHAHPSDRELALKKGFDDYLIKPIAFSTLAEVLKRFLSKA